MTQIQIIYYIKTCDTGNIAQAADALFVSRSAVSRAIADLEKEFQTELIIRSKYGVEPTPAGKIVYEMAKNFSGSYFGVVNRIQELKEFSYSRRVRVGVTPINGVQIYAQYLRDYFHNNPNKELILTESPAASCLDLLSKGDIDVAFIPGSFHVNREDEPFFRAVPLYQNQAVLWVRKDSPLAKMESLEIHDILDCPLGYLLAPMPYAKTLKSCFEAYGKQPRVTVRTSSVPLLRQMVLDGQACAILADDTFEPSPELVKVPLRFLSSSTIFLMWNKNIPTSEAVKHFIAAVSPKVQD